MPLEIRELVIKITVEENSNNSNANTGELAKIEQMVNRLEEQLAELHNKIENIYTR